MKKLILIYTILLCFQISYAQSLDSGLVAKYYFTNASTLDESEFGYNANYCSATPTINRFNQDNSAFHFDGTQYINIPYSQEFSSENMTVSLWFKSSSTSLSRLIALPFSGSPSWSLNYYANPSSPNGVSFYAGFSQPSPWTPYWAKTPDIEPDNTWHFIAGVRDESKKMLYIYFDCHLVDSNSYSGEIYAPNRPLNIGRYDSSYGQYFTGTIDDIRIYNRVLLTSEIELLCNEDSTGIIESPSHTILNFISLGYSVPNVFTPGTNDIINNEFYFPDIKNQPIIEFKCTVYNRWGQEIFKFNRITDKWNGKSNDRECVDGVYYYVYHGKLDDNTIIRGQGNIHLIRSN